MILVKLSGGLGNQLFQYATGRRLSHKLNSDLKLDLSGYPDRIGRTYRLADFDIKASVATATELIKFQPSFVDKLSLRLLPSLDNRIVKEKGFGFDEKILDVKDNKYLIGYWQSEKYFKDIEIIIRAEITLKNGLSEAAKRIKENILSTDAVSIHIRRSDYLTEKISNVLESCGKDYYANASKRISEQVRSPHFFVFSDEIAWAKENLKLPYPLSFVSDKGLRDCEELILMSLCRHNIIANSSFSWWGAWLNENPDKIVIAPNDWFKDKNTDLSHLVPNAWQRI